MKILIVDDVPANRRLLRAVLETQGFGVIEASNGVEGLALLEPESVNAIISDILMPDMDGYRFCEEVRRNKCFRHLPFIIYTSTYTSAADEKLALAMGADKYLKKPAPVAEITGALNEVIKRGKISRPGPLPVTQELNRSRIYNETITHKLEQKRRELSEQALHLRSSEDKLQQLTENISDVLWNESKPSQEKLPPV
jgi:CheY-like chemotaxis protein